MKTFVINFPNDTIRKHFQEKQLNGYDHTFVEGINGYTLDYSKLNLNTNRDIFRKLKKGEIGCLLSHLKSYENALELKLKEVLILEDDAELCENFYEKLKLVLTNAPNKWDILLLSSTNVWRKYKNKVSKTTKVNEYFSLIEGDHYGNQGYIINNNAMQTLLDFHKNNPLTYPADNLLTKVGLNVFLLNNEILTTRRGLGSFTLNHNRYKKLDLINHIDTMVIEY